MTFEHLVVQAPRLKQSQREQVAQDQVQSGFEYF